FSLTNQAVVFITPSTTERVVDAPTLVIQGTGFDPLGTNSVTFSSGAVGTITAVTSTQITVTLTTPPSVGTPNATGNTRGVSSDPQPVAIVVSIPGVLANFTNIPASASTLTIRGNAFDPAPGNNSVILSSGAIGIVTTATPTQLTVQLVLPPTAGILTAIVT